VSVADLPRWREGPTKEAVLAFVDRAVTELPPEERVAVFDNDGTLWCEKPCYVQLDFLLRRFAEQAQLDPSLRSVQPYLAAATGDLGWFADAVTKHERGDDTDFAVLVTAVLSAHHAISVDDHARRVDAFFDHATHPTLGRPYTSCGYSPMVDLLHYLAANGFTNYVVSGGGRDFMRRVTARMYGIPPERVVGSSVGLTYRDADVFTTAEPEFLDDGPMKPVRLWSRIGRRPVLAAGNSDGDREMLEFTRGLRLLIRHDDADREFAYDTGAQRALADAGRQNWTVVSMRDDWTTVFD
jgi:phosphoglycolate phosphatase-like HAD superfamily hydrolase